MFLSQIWICIISTTPKLTKKMLDGCQSGFQIGEVSEERFVNGQNPAYILRILFLLDASSISGFWRENLEMLTDGNFEINIVS